MALDDTDGIMAQNIVDTFNEYVLTTVNDGIVWGQDNPPMYGSTLVVPTSQFGGSSSGTDPVYTGYDLLPADGSDKIVATNIYNTLVIQTRLYTQIRKLRAQLILTGSPQSVLFDQTEKAFMADAFRQTFTTPQPSGLARGKTITAVTLESFFTTLQAGYTAKANNTYFYQSSVCHTSCHASCHSSRIRR